MEYIVSRGFVLPESFDSFANSFWFSLWHRKMWPYEEVMVGDILYWYQSPDKRIVWKSRIAEVDRFHYDTKESMETRLRTKFGTFNVNQSYLVESPERGFCLAWKALPIERIDLPRPSSLRFPRQGWLRVDNNIALNWLNDSRTDDNLTLDDIMTQGSVFERIRQLDIRMADIIPERVRSVVERTLRHDTQLVRSLKELCGFRCQFPGCGVRISKRDGGFYVEVAHIQPVHEGGRSILGNLLVLCPNHHKEFDYGNLEVIEQTFDRIRGKLNATEFEIQLPDAEGGRFGTDDNQGSE